jgi:hypothetical protein
MEKGDGKHLGCHHSSLTPSPMKSNLDHRPQPNGRFEYWSNGTLDLLIQIMIFLTQYSSTPSLH